LQVKSQKQVVLPVFTFDAYNRSVPLASSSDLIAILKNAQNGLTVLATILIQGALGTYNISVFVPYAGAFSFFLQIKSPGGNDVDIVGSPISIIAVSSDEGLDLLILWIVLGLVGALGAVILVVILVRRFGRRRSYAPLASTTSKKSFSCFVCVCFYRLFCFHPRRGFQPLHSKVSSGSGWVCVLLHMGVHVPRAYVGLA
jgi:hypothetical protein